MLLDDIAVILVQTTPDMGTVDYSLVSSGNFGNITDTVGFVNYTGDFGAWTVFCGGDGGLGL